MAAEKEGHLSWGGVSWDHFFPGAVGCGCFFKLIMHICTFHRYLYSRPLFAVFFIAC